MNRFDSRGSTVYDDDAVIAVAVNPVQADILAHAMDKTAVEEKRFGCPVYRRDTGLVLTIQDNGKDKLICNRGDYNVAIVVIRNGRVIKNRHGQTTEQAEFDFYPYEETIQGAVTNGKTTEKQKETA